MAEKYVRIKLSPDGKIVVEAEGFKGGSCEEATAFLEKLFKKTGRQYKPSYYEQEEIVVNQLPSGYCG
jgi:hypothetical protein